MNDLIRRGGADVSLVCTLAYVLGNHDFGMELLAAPVVHGEQVYRSYIIVHVDNTAGEIPDLEGKLFAFTDPLSNSGHLSPLFALHQRGHTPAMFLGKHIFTYSHDKSIRAVANRFVDSAAVARLVHDEITRSDPALGA